MNYSLPIPLLSQEKRAWYVDQQILLPVLALISIGLVMVASASFSFAEHRFGDALFFLKRHLAFAVMGIAAMLAGYLIPADFWLRHSRLWILLSLVLLSMVLVPGIGREFNGSRRWLSLAGFTLQVSELAKLALVIYLGDYLSRRREVIRSDWREIGRPLGVLGLFVLLLILEPDFGSVVVLSATATALLFLGGARLSQFALLALAGGLALWWLASAAPYRVERLTAFLDPWSDQYNAGYQLTQSLIAFGRGEWFGVGLGQSVQKLLYLPEAHTDFVFAIFAEEFGFVGVLGLVAIYVLLIARLLLLGRESISQQRWYFAFVLIGCALLIGGQTFINLGVNAGLLPTKGLTLPFISYGGSSILVSCATIGLLLRVSHELRDVPPAPPGKRGRRND